jgi:small subunit ribosomal protein S16
VITFEQEKVLKWLQTGAQPYDTVASLLKKVGILDLFHELQAGRSIEGKNATPRAAKEKKAKLGPKAKARLEAEKAAKEAPAEAPAADAQA